jgi:hypothetical protein
MKNLNDSEADLGLSEVTSPELNRATIATLEHGFSRLLSPMRRVRFSYTASWKNARLGQNWLSLSEVGKAHEHIDLQNAIALRFENWGFVPPATKNKKDCAFFAYSPFETDETYLVWEENNQEPHIWECFGGDYSVFRNLERYLEYIVGDRKNDDRSAIRAHRYQTVFNRTRL